MVLPTLRKNKQTLQQQPQQTTFEIFKAFTLIFQGKRKHSLRLHKKLKESVDESE